MGEKTQFCAACGREMPYDLQKSSVTRYIPKKEYTFEIVEAVCAGCGAAVGVPGLLDHNAAWIEQQYRELKLLLSLSEKMRSAILRLLKTSGEVTPLALQKMLYFMQGIYMALFDGELFREDCQAWAHGPVYQEVYEVFRDFQYHPIEDARFLKLGDNGQELSEYETKVIDLVVEAFRPYSGKTLERVTHKEIPWKEARADCLSDQRSNEMIPKASIKKYFRSAAERYDLASAGGIREYIDSRLRME